MLAQQRTDNTQRTRAMDYKNATKYKKSRRGVRLAHTRTHTLCSSQRVSVQRLRLTAQWCWWWEISKNPCHCFTGNHIDR